MVLSNFEQIAILLVLGCCVYQPGVCLVAAQHGAQEG